MRTAKYCGTILLFLILTTSELFAQDLTGELRSWIQEQASPLSTVQPGSGIDDLHPLRGIVGDARIVALGEETHGAREIYQLKHRLVEFLVTEMDFGILAVEATFAEALDLNRYVLTGEGDPAKAVAGLYFWTLDTEEILALVHWMRQYNLEESNRRKIKFYGIDMQAEARSAKTVLSFLRRIDGGYDGLTLQSLELLADPFLSAEAISHHTESERERLAETLGNLATDFDEQLEDYASETSIEETELVRQHLEILLQGWGPDPISRGNAMASNAEWILDREGPDSKMIVWAHNRHVAAQEDTMGGSLRRTFGDDLRVIGAVFGRGGFQARDVMVDGALRPWFVDSATGSTLEAHLIDAAPQIALLNLHSLPDAGLVTSWFHEPQTMRWIGSGYTDTNPEWYWWSAPIAEVYDAIAFIQETTPARSTVTGRVPGVVLETNPVNLGFENGLNGAWPPGWIGPRGIAQLQWQVSLTDDGAYEGEQAVLINRDSNPLYGETYGELSQRIDASAWRGRNITLTAWLKVESETKVHLWIETEGGSESSFDHRTVIDNEEWTEYEITSSVEENTEAISFGAAVVGEGRAWLDSVSIK